ncbi:AAA domain-containing protein [Hypoxylon argillaceum]|nr:AAA domain-containing protein [Hypoxylon argillaceum]
MATPPNIYIIGSQCTGKTTLVNALSAHFSQHPPPAPAAAPGVIKEVARHVLKKHAITRGDLRSSPARALELQQLIIDAQSEAETAQLAAHRGAWFISDRSVLDPVVYARRYVSREAADVLTASEGWIAMRGRMARSLVVVCEAGVDWGLVDDGVRLMPLDGAEWWQTHAEFCTALADVGLEYHILPSGVGSTEERVQFVLARWEERRKELVINGGEHEHAKA